MKTRTPLKRLSGWLVLSLLILTAHDTAHAQVFTDGTFASGWTSLLIPPTASGAICTATQNTSDGNPAPSRATAHTYPLGHIFCAHILSSTIYTPSIQGAIVRMSYSYDLIKYLPPGDGSGGVGYSLLVYQGGNYYRLLPEDIIPDGQPWTPFPPRTNLTAADFSNMAGEHPNFSCHGPELQFGYVTRNHKGSGTGTDSTHSGIDNWTVSIDEKRPCQEGHLKVCKVAGPGVAVGTPFTFTAGGSTFTVPAGPAPGGTCVVGPTFPVGSVVTVVESIPPGDSVVSIDVAPPGQVVGAPNLATGTVSVTMGSGVTEVTYTDQRTGFLEICKRPSPTVSSGNFTFTVGSLGPVVVPVGACSPAIEVPAGMVTITEVLPAGTVVAGCSTIPAGQQVSCNNPVANTSTVTVVPGDISQQTIAFITNAIRFVTTGTGRTSTTLACAPNPALLRGAVACVAKVAPAPSDSGRPTGTVTFRDGDVTLATAPLGADGTATFTTSALAAGAHTIVGTYDGDTLFATSTSAKVVETVGP